VRTHGCTSTTAYLALVLATPERPDDADNPLRVCWSSNQPALEDRFEERFDVHLMSAYGSTEAGFPVLSRWRHQDRSQRWLGTPRRGYDIDVVDEHGRPVADGDVGELLVRPPDRALVLTEYVNRPDVTAAAVRDGWYRTGDAVRRHPAGPYAGELVFVDRLSDTLRRHGENISSAAVEAAVQQEPEVLECAVLGVPDPVAGQEVLLVVRPQEGAVVDPADLCARLADRVPTYALPRWVLVVAELPTTATHKVRKRGLLEQLDLSAAWERPARRPS
jgi:crotonobetaine/carnitine-CoA ligase